MQAKRILAGIFAGIILIKLLVGLANPAKWLAFAGALLGHSTIVVVFYLIIIAITGYYIFTSLNLIDIAVVMFFTSMLTALSLAPYAETFLKLGNEVAAKGFGRAWLALSIWGALAVAILFKVFGKGRI